MIHKTYKGFWLMLKILFFGISSTILLRAICWFAGDVHPSGGWIVVSFWVGIVIAVVVFVFGDDDFYE